ncbi:hypothetical protein NQ317_004841 [Molorchus minor]|uniref:Uncharacterized protein n=1 Tax=Molorchus minor TaxID=1323400 RepID=A0ABQ9J437_9CUCU|nr:hypothetical protein NQ317_004841 [Molorchus minor]
MACRYIQHYMVKLKEYSAFDGAPFNNVSKTDHFHVLKKCPHQSPKIQGIPSFNCENLLANRKQEKVIELWWWVFLSNILNDDGLYPPVRDSSSSL